MAAVDAALSAEPQPADNASIAQVLREMAVLLEVQGDNPFQVAAYRRAADTVARLLHPLRDIHGTAGTAGLDALPGTVSRNAAAIGELLTTGSWTQLARLRGAANPVRCSAPFQASARNWLIGCMKSSRSIRSRPLK